MGKTLHRRITASRITLSTTLVLGSSLVSSMVIHTPALANVGQTYGFGSRTAALAGTGVARSSKGYSSYSNPASLATPQNERLVLSWGVLSMTPSFTDINNIVVSNDYTGDSANTMGDVDLDYESTFGQVLGLNYRILPDSALTFGLTSFMPISHVAAFDTGESYVPEYFLHRSRTQRPQFDLGLGYDPGETGGWLIGVGAHIGFSMTATGKVFLQGDESKPSTMRFATSLKPKAAPYLGLMYEGNERKTTFGAVVRAPLTSPSHMELTTGARLFGDLAALDFNFSSYSALFYDPGTIELGAGWQYSKRGHLFLQVDAQFWGLYEPPSLEINDPSLEECTADPADCGLDISGSLTRQLDFRHILVPRIAHEYDFGRWVFRTGYAYQPSVLARLPRGAGNYLDLSKHIITLGAGLRFKRFLSFNTPVQLDFHASLHQMVSQKVTKTPGNEGNTAVGDEKIGAPGYTAGGRELGGGFSLNLAF